MLRTTRLKLKNRGSVRGIANYLRQSAEYYAQAESAILPPAQWSGAIAEKLRLNEEGRDAEKDLANLLLGLDPNTGEKLVQNAGKENRRLGWDLTFSPEKAIDVAFITADSDEQKRILSVHNQAVNEALAFVQENLFARAGHNGTERKDSKGLCIRQVVHIDSREADAQLHTHNIIVNLALGDDGKLRSVEEKTLLQIEKAAGAFYRQRIAQGMKSLGYGVDRKAVLDADGRETGMVKTSINGISEAAEKALSTRSQQIKDEVEKSGISRDQAALKTRKNKAKDLDPSEVIAHCLNKLHSQGLLQFHNANELKNRRGLDLEHKTKEKILEELHAQESSFNYFKLVEKLANSGYEQPVQDAKTMIAEAIKDGSLIELKEQDRTRQFCSKAQWDMEAVIGNKALARKDDQSIRLAPERVAQAIAEHEQGQGFKLSPEQCQSVEFVACGTGGLAILSGQAGTGKTATAGAYIKAFEASGFKVYGSSSAQAATEKLEAEAGIESYNTTSLLSRLDSGKIKLDAKSVIVLDEAGMVGAKTFRRIQEHIDQAGGKLIAVGDALQLQPIESGSPFRVLIHDLGDAKLTEIRRQKGEVERAIANDFYKEKSGQSIVEDWKKSGMVKSEKSRNDSIKSLVQDYMQDQRPQREKLILAQTHEDVGKVTEELRGAFKAKGQLADGVAHTITKNDGTKKEIELAIGDRLRIQKNNRSLGVANNDLAEVIGFNETKKGREIIIKLESDVEHKNGKTITLPSDFDRFNYGYASTVHSAQGQGKDSVYWLMKGAKSLDRSMGMVAFTRTNQDFKGYCTHADEAKIKTGLEQWGKKLTAQELGRKEEPLDIAKKFLEEQQKKRAEERQSLEDRKIKLDEVVLECSGVIEQKNGTEQSFKQYLTARGEARAQVKKYEEKAANAALQLGSLKPWNFKQKSELQQQLSRYQKASEEAKREWKDDDKEQTYQALLKRLPTEQKQAESAQMKLTMANFELEAIGQKLTTQPKPMIEKLREKNAQRRQQEQALKSSSVYIPPSFNQSVQQVRQQDHAKAATMRPPQMKPRGMSMGR
ncbi:hypothetical protein CEX93_10985 [Xanthomonas euvesicatoria]|nr:MobF family relaxase [Xanthomonas perforans]PWH27402.1 hypothetical protein CEX93_10985 [Xanthomonas euvesicatoria]MDC9671780.1 relaxase domain-containing protein [Xanthomonas perforans]RXD46964.1 hypothetical protein DB761_04830 [Xanthomonas perforans]RXD49130.1 hypothetical protein DB768_10180 [Xanthomonas perforans]RXD58646.1 hypothetical protein DB759_19935 [Xanthomonas perforans]